MLDSVRERTTARRKRKAARRMEGGDNLSRKPNMNHTRQTRSHVPGHSRPPPCSTRCLSSAPSSSPATTTSTMLCSHSHRCSTSNCHLAGQPEFPRGTMGRSPQRFPTARAARLCALPRGRDSAASVPQASSRLTYSNFHFRRAISLTYRSSPSLPFPHHQRRPHDDGCARRSRRSQRNNHWPCRPRKDYPHGRTACRE